MTKMTVPLPFSENFAEPNLLETQNCTLLPDLINFGRSNTRVMISFLLKIYHLIDRLQRLGQLVDHQRKFVLAHVDYAVFQLLHIGHRLWCM